MMLSFYNLFCIYIQIFFIFWNRRPLWLNLCVQIGRDYDCHCEDQNVGFFLVTDSPVSMHYHFYRCLDYDIKSRQASTIELPSATHFIEGKHNDCHFMTEIVVTHSGLIAL